MNTYRKPLLHKPPYLSEGGALFLMPEAETLKRDERCVTYRWLSRRAVFGQAYRSLLPDYFNSMPIGSGVLIGSFIPSDSIVPGLTFPGDIDVLVIPYEGNELVLSYALAIEIKIVRASYARQGKSPNEFGFSQAQAMLAAGFPYVAVGHLIVSDESPQHAWREAAMTKLVDDDGTCGPIETVLHDMLPWDLLSRAHGRLARNCPDPVLGYFSSYPEGRSVWYPDAKEAIFNPFTSKSAMDGVYAYYEKNHGMFLLTPRHSHPTPPTILSIGTPEHMTFLAHMVEKLRRDFRR